MFPESRSCSSVSSHLEERGEHVGQRWPTAGRQGDTERVCAETILASSGEKRAGAESAVCCSHWSVSSGTAAGAVHSSNLLRHRQMIVIAMLEDTMLKGGNQFSFCLSCFRGQNKKAWCSFSQYFLYHIRFFSI